MTPVAEPNGYVNKWLTEMDSLLDSLGEGCLSVSEVLEELLQHTANAHRLPVYVPEVTLLLATGGQVTGVLLARSHTTSGVLAVGVEHLASREKQVVFVQIGHVVGIAVQNPEQIGRIISGTEVPGRLEISRQARQLSETLDIDVQVSVPEDEEGRMAVYALLTTFASVCQILWKDPAAKSALTEGITQVHIRVGEGRMTCHSQKIDIPVNGLLHFPTTEQVLQQLEALL